MQTGKEEVSGYVLMVNLYKPIACRDFISLHSTHIWRMWVFNWEKTYTWRTEKWSCLVDRFRDFNRFTIYLFRFIRLLGNMNWNETPPYCCSRIYHACHSELLLEPSFSLWFWQALRSLYSLQKATQLGIILWCRTTVRIYIEQLFPERNQST